ncbi:putative TIM-barrel fold metal-dependent hydrolase [Streptosporangium album]|uniref:Putative TIM-barrel fold metal-dependent hydrolase n=1 Tax=Streptosporangium album TaxID=47479 RepID=A0A7W7S4C2_9ACTN|nr:amidohydrolase family protein [Streptosporangium album]MBB4942701.1 putative TIM-barrel fold metal-dependent hydrolase [Streptosporangium album]
MTPLQTMPMRTTTSNTQPRFSMPPMSCDSHFHVFEPGYAHVPEPLYTFPDGTLEQYLRLADRLGIERMVLVQPTFYDTDNSLLLDVLRKVGSRCRGVVRVDDSVSDAELDALHDAGVRAIRLDLFARADWSTEELVAYLRAMTDRARLRGWHLQFYTPGAVVQRLLPFLTGFEHTFVIDHMGYGMDLDGLLPLLAGGFCYLKLSGPYRLKTDVEALARALVEARPDRLLWGSDWPHLPNGQRDTGELLNLLAGWAPSPEDRHQILVEAPGRLFYAQ